MLTSDFSENQAWTSNPDPVAFRTRVLCLQARAIDTHSHCSFSNVLKAAVQDHRLFFPLKLSPVANGPIKITNRFLSSGKHQRSSQQSLNYLLCEVIEERTFSASAQVRVYVEKHLSGYREEYELHPPIFWEAGDKSKEQLFCKVIVFEGNRLTWASDKDLNHPGFLYYFSHLKVCNSVV